MSKGKISFFTLSRVNNRYLYIFIALTLFLAPNLVFLFPSLYGVFLTHLVWIMLVLLLTPLVSHRGLGHLGVRGAVNIGLALIIILTMLGFFLGFYYRRSYIQSLLIDMALLIIKISAAEVARTSVMAITSNRALKMLLGTLMGLFFGLTLLSTRFVEFFTPSSGLISNIPQIIYSILVTEIHMLGGLYPALAFRYIVDGYWRLSPYILNTSSLGILSPLILSFIYMFAMVLIPGYERIRGSSAAIFKRSFKKILSLIADISILAIIVLISYSLYAGIVPLVVISGSMEPTIGMGDIALIVRVRNLSDIRVGDVIAFWNENQIVVHRVIDIVRGGFITKGDANPSPDPFIVNRDFVVGRVIGSIPKIGWITIIIRSSPEGLRNIASHIYTNLYSSPTLIISIISIILIAFIPLIILYRRKEIHRIG